MVEQLLQLCQHQKVEDLLCLRLSWQVSILPIKVKIDSFLKYLAKF